MANYFDKVIYLYPGIQGVSYWGSQYDGTPWEDLYDGLIWENKDISKPSKDELDKLDDATVDMEIAARVEVLRKAARDLKCKQDLGCVANYKVAVEANPKLTWTDYLDQLESYIKDL